MSNQFLNIFFTLNSQNILIQARGDELFAEVVVRYINKLNPKEGETFKYFFNSQELVPEAAKTLSDYNIKDRSSINVVLTSILIGASSI